MAQNYSSDDEGFGSPRKPISERMHAAARRKAAQAKDNAGFHSASSDDEGLR